ncbi:unnamed protein product [Arctogadus glacialis]
MCLPPAADTGHRGRACSRWELQSHKSRFSYVNGFEEDGVQHGFSRFVDKQPCNGLFLVNLMMTNPPQEMDPLAFRLSSGQQSRPTDHIYLSTHQAVSSSSELWNLPDRSLP